VQWRAKISGWFSAMSAKPLFTPAALKRTMRPFCVALQRHDISLNTAKIIVDRY
jgi:hypothetical protein